jgi:hypothetical protein
MLSVTVRFLVIGGGELAAIVRLHGRGSVAGIEGRFFDQTYRPAVHLLDRSGGVEDPALDGFGLLMVGRNDVTG